uniref:Uncharacterized protein n=1 Tax=Oryza punctata TaxID=4537 RepID=A0A0E0M150_ORYPU
MSWWRRRLNEIGSAEVVVYNDNDVVAATEIIYNCSAEAMIHGDNRVVTTILWRDKVRRFSEATITFGEISYGGSMEVVLYDDDGMATMDMFTVRRLFTQHEAGAW